MMNEKQKALKDAVGGKKKKAAKKVLKGNVDAHDTTNYGGILLVDFN